MFRRFFDFWLSATIAGVYWVWSRTWRIERVREPKSHGVKPRIVWAHWHGDEVLLLRLAMLRPKMAVMTSHSRDGSRMERMLRWFGFDVVKGSSSRGGGAGLKGLIDSVRHEGREASLAVDGPRGPLYRVKPGIVKLARETGALIIPSAGAAKRRVLFPRAWNDGYLPLPFTRAVVVYGEPMAVASDASDEELERCRVELEKRLGEAKAHAEGWFGRGKKTL